MSFTCHYVCKQSSNDCAFEFEVLMKIITLKIRKAENVKKNINIRKGIRIDSWYRDAKSIRHNVLFIFSDIMATISLSFKLAVLVVCIGATFGCTCFPAHPQQQFCDSDFGK